MPVPLNDRGFKQRCRGVRVVFEKLRRGGAVIHQIEPAIDRWRLLLPGVPNERTGRGGDMEGFEAVAVDNELARCEAKPLQLLSGGFELIDLAGAEAIADGFVPIRVTVGRMELKTETFHFRLPVRTRLDSQALHKISLPGSIRPLRRRRARFHLRRQRCREWFPTRKRCFPSGR